MAVLNSHDVKQQFGTLQADQSSTQQPAAHESHLATVEHCNSSQSMRRVNNHSRTNIETSQLDVQDVDISLSSKVNVSRQNNRAIRVKLKEDVLEKFKESLKAFNEKNKKMKV